MYGYGNLKIGGVIGMKKMKKKLLVGLLSLTLLVGVVIPLSASAAESWDYGYNKTTMQWYNDYLHSSKKHYGSIYKNGVTYFGPTANPNGWSRLRLDFNGPYAVQYYKHTVN